MSASPMRPGGSRLAASGVTLAYPGADEPVLHDVSAPLDHGSMTVIVGPNACGKSTLLRTFARVLRPSAGSVTLDGKSVASHSSKEFARAVGFLPQSAIAPEGITVGDLVSRGRYPHQGMLRQWSDADEASVVAALDRTATWELRDRRVEDLSGGQRQRVWIAMVLAQQTDILLLDEPTTFLDIAHQLEIMELCRELKEEHGTTVVAVLHDLNHAARYADRIIAMRAGRVIAHGTPEDVVTGETVHDVFGIPARVIPDPETGTPLVVPLAGARARRAEAELV